MAIEENGETGFTERDFYLSEFRGRTVAIALRAGCGQGPGGAAALEGLRGVLDELVANATRVVLLSPERELLAKFLGQAAVELASADWAAELWRAVRKEGKSGLVLPGGGEFAAACHAASQRLGFAKLVWVDDPPLIRGPGAEAASYVDLEGLDLLLGANDLSPERRAFLKEIRAMIDEGLPAVNVCSLGAVREELFTYAGAGTLFTREGYTVVRDLALHEFDAAHHLMGRGVAEGFLLERSREQKEHVLAHTFGVFVEDRYLAGIGALLPYSGSPPMGEVVSLYTVTRFVGEGVGAHLLRFAAGRARSAGLETVFACTSSATVEKFFVRNGYSIVEADTLPASKWREYPEARRPQVRCLALETVGVAGGGL